MQKDRWYYVELLVAYMAAENARFLRKSQLKLFNELPVVAMCRNYDCIIVRLLHLLLVNIARLPWIIVVYLQNTMFWSRWTRA